MTSDETRRSYGINAIPFRIMLHLMHGSKDFISIVPGTYPLSSWILLLSVRYTGIRHTCVVKYVLHFVIYTFAYILFK